MNLKSGLESANHASDNHFRISGIGMEASSEKLELILFTQLDAE